MRSTLAGPGVRALAHRAGLVTGLQILTLVGRLGLIVILTRSLGAADYGTYAYALNLTLVLFGLAQFGTGPVLAHRLGTAEDPAPIIAVAALLRSLTAAGTVLALLVWAWAVAVPASVMEVLAVFAAALLMRAGAILFEGALVATGRAGEAVACGAARLGLEIAAVGGLALAGAPLWALALANAVSWALLLLALARRIGPLRLPESPFVQARALAYEGAPVGIVVALTLWILQSPMLLMHGHLDDTAFGHLALAVQIAVIARLLPGTLAGVALPMLARAARRGDQRDAQFTVGLTHLIWIFGGIAVLIAPDIAAPLVRLIFGGDYAGAAGVVAASAWLMLVGALVVPVETEALMRKASGRLAMVQGVAALGVWAVVTWRLGGLDGETTILLAAAGLGAAALAGTIAIADPRTGRVLVRTALLGAAALTLAYASTWIETETTALLPGWGAALLFIAAMVASLWFSLPAHRPISDPNICP